MGVNRFIFLILICSIFFIFYKKDISDIQEKEDVKPLVSFNNSVMYDLSTKNIEHIIQSKEAHIYKTHDELYDATILTKAKESNDSKEVNNISANNIVRYDNELYLDGKVIFNSYDGLIFKTDDLQYNIQNKIAKTSSNFVASQGNHTLKGEALLYDSKNRYMVASKTNFKIEVKDSNESVK